jgi:hypothetical protein
MLIMPMSIADSAGSHREAVEDALGGISYLKQGEIQKLHIQALMALDDTLRAILAELRSQGMEDAPTERMADNFVSRVRAEQERINRIPPGMAE